MRQVSVICWKCGALVPVVDKTISEHNGCEAGGGRYVPSPRFLTGPGGPSYEVLASTTIDVPCESCGGNLEAGIALVKVHMLDPSVN